MPLGVRAPQAGTNEAGRTGGVEGSRRAFLGILAGAGMGTLVGSEDVVAATLKGLKERRLKVHNLNTLESLDIPYWRNGHYLPDAMKRASYVLRDHVNNMTHKMDPRLFDLLQVLSHRLGSHEPYQVICGYRSPATNWARARYDGQVASHSYHMRGMAIDVRLPGRATAGLYHTVVAAHGGGAGYYGRSDFVHVDVGPVRTWRGT